MNPTTPKINTIWPRWSSYEVKEYHDVAYLLPAEDAEYMPYRISEDAEILVADALELGRQAQLDAPEISRLCAAFAARHGLLGLGAGKDPSLFKNAAAAPCYRPLDSKQYGDIFLRFLDELKNLYLHFAAIQDGKSVQSFSGEIRYRLIPGNPTQLVWETDSLLSVLHLTYASLISSPVKSLRICRNCGKVYCNPHVKSEFCGTKCRNCYNVRVFREREKKR